MNDSIADPLGPNPNSREPAALRVFGLGSTGVKILGALAAEGHPASALVAVDSDPKLLANSAAAEKIQLQLHKLSNHSHNGAGAHAPAAAEEQMPRLKALCEGVEVVFIIAGLGGAVGTGLASVLASAAADSGAFVLAFTILPFDCEGTLRGQVARAGLERLKESADLVLCLPNQKTVTTVDAGATLLDTFKASNALLARCVSAAWRSLKSETLMGLSFLELCRLLREHSNTCAFAVAELTGPNRASNAIDRLIDHPLVDGLASLPQAPAIAVCVLGGPALALAEVTRIMEHLHAQSESTPVLMGAGISAAVGESLVVVLLVGTREERPAEPEPDYNHAQRGGGSRCENLDTQLLERDSPGRRHSRFLPPAPNLPAEKMAQLLKAQSRGGGTRLPKAASRFRQAQLPLEIVSKGRFDKSEPTIHRGEDLDVPTYIRRGVALN